MTSTRMRSIVAVGLVLALVGSGALALVSGGGDDSGRDEDVASVPTPSPSPVPRPSVPPEELSRREAATEFRRLHGLANKLTRQRDSFFVEKVFTATGPMLERSRTRIAELLDTKVLDRSRSRLERVKVRSLEGGEIRIHTVIHSSPCFVSEGGRDVTQDPRVVRNEVLWTMRWEDGAWKLHDAELRDQKASKRKYRGCTR